MEESTTKVFQSDDEAREILKSITHKNKSLLLCLLLALLVLGVGLIFGYREKNSMNRQIVERYVDQTVKQLNQLETEKYVASALESYYTEMDIVASAIRDVLVLKPSEEEFMEFIADYGDVGLTSENEEFYLVTKQGEVLISSEQETKDIIESGIVSGETFREMTARADLEGRCTAANEKEDTCLLSFEKIDLPQDETKLYLVFVKELIGIDEQVYDTIMNDATFSNYIDSGNQFTFLEINCLNGEILSTRGSGFNSMEELGLTTAQLEAADGQWIKTAEGKSAYVRMVEDLLGKTAILGLINKTFSDAVFNKGLSIAAAVAWCFLILCILLLLYGYYLYRRRVGYREFFKQVLYTMIVADIVFSGFSIAFVSIAFLTAKISVAEQEEKLLAAQLEALESRGAEIIESNEQHYLDSASRLAGSIAFTGVSKDEKAPVHYYYAKDESGDYAIVDDSFGNHIVGRESVQQIAEKKQMVNAENIWIINEKGYAIASATENWNVNIQEYSKEDSFRKVLYRQQDYLVEPLEEEGGKRVGTLVVFPVDLYACDTKKGITEYVSRSEYHRNEQKSEGEKLRIEPQLGILMIYMPGDLDSKRQIEAIRDKCIGEFVAFSDCNYVVLQEVTDERGPSEYQPVSTHQREGSTIDLHAVTVPETMKGDELNFFRTYSEQECFVHMICRHAKAVYCAIVYECSYIKELALKVALAAVLSGMLGFGILAYCMIHARKQNESLLQPDTGRTEEEKEKLMFAFAYISVTDRDRLLRLLSVMLLLPALRIFSVFAPILDTKMTTGSYTEVFDGTWERALNYVNAFAAIMFFFMAQVMASMIKVVGEVITRPLGKKIESIVRLFLSILQFAVLFGSIMYGVYLLGVDLKSIGTVATIVAGVLAFSSQQIINDLNNGFLLFFEGKIEIGRRIACEGFVGVISEIGFRSATVLADNGQKRAFPYSRMSSITIYPEDEPFARMTKEQLNDYARKKIEEQKRAEWMAEQEALAAGSPQESAEAAPEPAEQNASPDPYE